jgi:Flp pilus assembly protein TadG
MLKTQANSVMRKRTQRGASAIEFSFVFGLLFMTFWAVLSYAFPFFLYQVMNQSTAETARYAIRIDPTQSNAAIISLAQAKLNQELSVLPPRFRRSDTVVQSVTIQTIDTFRTLVITLTYPGCSSTNKPACIVPPLRLIGFSLPNLSAFSATSRLRLESM